MEKTELRFRPMTTSDLDFVSDWLSDKEDVSMFERSFPVPVNRELIGETWKHSLECSDPPKSLWYMLETTSNEAVGICGLQSINYIHGDAVIPVFVSKGFRRKGVASIMVHHLIEMAFVQLRLHRLSTVYRSDNEASAEVISAAGFKVEGKAREAWFGEGKHHDIVYVGLLSSEWEKYKPKIEERMGASPFTVI